MKYINPQNLDLTDFIKAGDCIFCGQATGEPTTLTEKLVEQRKAIGPTEVFLGLTLSDTFDAEHADFLTFNSFGPMGNSKKLSDAGALNITPMHFGLISQYIKEGTLKCDVAFVLLSPRGPNGKHSFGVINDYIRAAIDKARIVIGEINDQVPWVYSDGYPELERFDVLIETSRPVLQALPSKVTSIDTKIADNVSKYINDEAILQIGMGSIPDAIALSIMDRRNLGFHSGMASDFLVDLMNSGVVTNITKPFDRGVSTTAILLGKTKLYEFADNNKELKLRPSWHTHSGDVHLLKNFVSINSALEVDLTGQVGAEELNGIPVSAIGGQPDLVRAAHRSDGGHAIIALPSSAKHGKFSRIVSKLSGPVTTARSDVDVIVTENGAADLRGKDLGQRRQALISIAAPNFQEDLMKT